MGHRTALWPAGTAPSATRCGHKLCDHGTGKGLWWALGTTSMYCLLWFFL